MKLKNVIEKEREAARMSVTAIKRSITPPGFAQAFYKANP